jgi:hypothetical protein
VSQDSRTSIDLSTNSDDKCSSSTLHTTDYPVGMSLCVMAQKLHIPQLHNGLHVVDYVATGCHLELFPTYPQSSTHNILQHAVRCPQLEEPRSCHREARVTRDANGFIFALHPAAGCLKWTRLHHMRPPLCLRF